MGQSETATASIGICILLSDLISQMNETNCELIKKMLWEGCIEDENGFYNETFKDIVGFDEYDNELPYEWSLCKEYLLEQFKNNGSYNKDRYTNAKSQDFTYGSLLEKELLVPIKEILSTERWGYNRTGINSSSRTMDFDLSVNTEEYKDIQNFKMVFIMKQYTG